MKTPKFIGLDTHYLTANGEKLRRIHMDGAASPLAAQTALETTQKVLPHYSNTHSYVHSSAHISTKALAWANRITMKFVGANPQDYSAIYTGSGATAAINRVARGLSEQRPNKKVILVSSMEHHANDLPHRQHNNEVAYVPLTGEGKNQGAVDLAALEQLLEKYRGLVNYIAVSLVSNVTGIINPITEIAELAHKHDAFIVVDGAQAVAHLPITLSNQDPFLECDFFIFSGHKLYAPGSPGVLIAKKELLAQMPGQDLGGGSVTDVSYYDYQLQEEYPDREQSGTPNIVGAISLASVMKELLAFGQDNILRHSNELLASFITSLSSIDNIEVYGDSASQRIGVIAFNHKHIDHGLLAAILNDYYAIAVRNECFCAHPYVSSMLKQSLWKLDLEGIPEESQQAYINRKRGMVRVSLSLYNNQTDINYLVKSLNEISENISEIKSSYDVFPDGTYRHKTFRIEWDDYLSL